MMNGEAPVYDGNTTIAISLNLATWNTVLTLISEAPWKTADPLMKEIQRQVGVGLQGVAPVNQPQGMETRQ